MLARRPEPVGDVDPGEIGKHPERGEPEPGEQADELGVGFARLLQPAHRLRGEEGLRGPRRHDQRSVPPRRKAGRDSRGEATVGDADSETGQIAAGLDGPRHRFDQFHGQLHVAAEVARRAAGFDAQPPRFDRLQPWREPPDRPHDRLEHAGIAVEVVVEEHRTRTALLGDPAPLPDRHPVRRCRR